MSADPETFSFVIHLRSTNYSADWETDCHNPPGHPDNYVRRPSSVRLGTEHLDQASDGVSVAARLQQKRSLAGLAPATVMQVASILHASLKEAVRRGLIMKNPADYCTPPTVLKRRHLDIWTTEPIAAYLADAEVTATPSVHAFYRTILATSCRPGELAGAPEGAIDLEHGIVRVHLNLVAPGRAPVFDAPKTDAGHRGIRVSTEAVDVIRSALVWEHEQKLRLGSRFHDGGTLFFTRSGRPLDLRVLRARDHLPRIERLGLPRITIYDLRHHSVSYAIANNVDARTAADRAGHRDPGYLIRRYAHAVAAAQDRAAEVCGNLVSRPRPLAP